MTYRELRSALVSKGNAEEDRRSHHVFFWIDIEGRRYRATKFSHGASGQISDSLLGKISHQMRLKAPELKDFVNCTVERDQWIELWCQRA